MAAPNLPPALDYLTDAAHLLQKTAPETSAHLLSHRNKRLRVHGLTQSDAQRQHVCGSCGHIMIVGAQSDLKLEARKPLRLKAKLSTPSSANLSNGPCKVISCGSCHSQTRISLSPPGAATRRQKAKQVISKKPAVDDAPKQTSNASSKKRAKNRKGGLQALLSSQQQPSKSLSLSDFMR